MNLNYLLCLIQTAFLGNSVKKTVFFAYSYKALSDKLLSIKKCVYFEYIDVCMPFSWSAQSLEGSSKLWSFGPFFKCMCVNQNQIKIIKKLYNIV